MTKAKTINIEKLLGATCDLESGHPVEAVLAQHGIPDNYSAYDVVCRHQSDIEHHRTAVSDFYIKKWKAHVAELRPVVAAVAECLGVSDG